MGLSDLVRQAADEAVRLIESLIEELRWREDPMARLVRWGVAAAAALLRAREWPEIRRYLEMELM